MNNKIKVVAIVGAGVIAGVAIGTKIVKTIKNKKSRTQKTKKKSSK